MRSNIKKHIYLDYTATTPIYPRVLKNMLPYFERNDLQGNTSSLHEIGRLSKIGLN